MHLGKSFWWALLIFLLSVFGSLVPSNPIKNILEKLAIIWGLIIVSCWIWTHFSLHGLSIRRSTRTLRQSVGEIFIERIEVINQSRFMKIWLRIDDQSELLGPDRNKILTNIGKNQSRTYSISTLLRYRGLFNLGPTVITAGDVFGLFENSKIIPSVSHLLVLPFQVSLSQFPAPFGVLPGGRAFRQKTTEVTPFSAGVREYQTGDPLRRIHWPTTVRKDKLIVKEFEKDPLTEVWIFIDLIKENHSKFDNEKIREKSQDTLFWMGFRFKFELPFSTLEYCISTAATVAKYFIYQNREVGFMTNDKNSSQLMASRGERHLEKILENLALLDANGEIPINILVQHALDAVVRGSTIVLITPAVDKAIVTTAVEILRRGILPIVVLIDSSPFGGNSQLGELETNLITLGIHVIRITLGGDLGRQLETGMARFSNDFVYPQRSILVQ